ncbi:hypothetical protein SDC9_119139 [bioreactor metagenome]|uniref:DNA mismatch repair protein MutS n=1 Tax=bioreactor metagenome TaxID=1076179 RepID=A0A645C2X2_9ZZZZ
MLKQEHKGKGSPPNLEEQLPLYASEEHPILKELKSADVMSMSPIEALNFMHQLQVKLRKE